MPALPAVVALSDIKYIPDECVRVHLFQKFLLILFVPEVVLLVVNVVVPEVGHDVRPKDIMKKWYVRFKLQRLPVELKG